MSARDCVAFAIRFATGVRSLPEAALPTPPFVVYANHSSHLDFAVVWAALPKRLRDRVRPVAGRDYWEKTSARRWLAGKVFRAVLIERQKVTVASNPLEPMLAALDAGDSLIVFPEGTRSTTGTLQSFKSGIYHIAHARRGVSFVPALLDNLNRVLPKGEFIAVPLLASLTIGTPVTLAEGESKSDFLNRTRGALVALQRQ